MIMKILCEMLRNDYEMTYEEYDAVTEYYDTVTHNFLQLCATNKLSEFE